MKNETLLLSRKRANLYKRFLTTVDYAEIASEAGYSYSSVNNILNRRTMITPANTKVIEAANKLCAQKMQKTKFLIREVEREKYLETAEA